jgi:hypothetical protein
MFSLSVISSASCFKIKDSINESSFLCMGSSKECSCGGCCLDSINESSFLCMESSKECSSDSS